MSFRERHFRIGGEDVLVRVAAALEEDLTTAMLHIEAPAAPPALTIEAWDAASGSCLAAPQDAEAIRQLDADGASFRQWADGRLHALDVESAAGWFWVEEPSRPLAERVAPLSPILAPWLQTRGTFLVHAAAIGTVDGCVLVVGGTGTGKSTTVLAGLAAGLGCVGDDTCLLRPGRPARALSAYDTVQFGTGAAEKEVFHLRERMPERVVLDAPVKAIAIARLVDGPGGATRPAGRAEAVATLAATTALRLPVRADATLAGLAHIVAGVPCHHLEVGEDEGALARAVAELL
jgi:hypothetical protein